MYLSTKGGKTRYINLLKSYNGAQCIRNKTSTLDKQRICVNTQLKSSKKQLK